MHGHTCTGTHAWARIHGHERTRHSGQAPSAVQSPLRLGYTLSVVWSASFDNGANISAYTLYTNCSALGEPETDELCGEVIQTGIEEAMTYVLSKNLVPHSPYVFQVTANNSVGESARSTPVTIFTDQWVPDQLQVSDFTDPPERTDSTITVAWTPPRDNGYIIEGYEIVYRCTSEAFSRDPDKCANALTLPTSGAGFSLNSAICAPVNGTGTACTQTSFTHSGLGSNLEYEYRVRSKNAYDRQGQDGWSEYSAWIGLRTAADAPLVPPVPFAAKVVEQNGTAVTLSWLVPSSASLGQIPAINRYTASYASASDPESRTVLPTILSGFSPGAWYNLTITNLRPDTTYLFEYAAGNRNSIGPPSNNQTFGTLRSVPGAPGKPVVDHATNVTISAQVGAALAYGYELDSYRVELCVATTASALQQDPRQPSNYSAHGCDFYEASPPIDSDASSLLLVLGPDAHPTLNDTVRATNRSLQPGTTYQVRVAARNFLGLGPYGEWVPVVTAAPPDVPTALGRGDGVNGLDPATAIQLVWDVPADYGYSISAYEVQMDGGVPTLLAAEPSYIAQPVLPGSTHYFSVRALNAYGWSGRSATANLTSQVADPTIDGPPSYQVSLTPTPTPSPDPQPSALSPHPSPSPSPSPFTLHPSPSPSPLTLALALALT